MSFFKRSQTQREADFDDEHDDNIDPELRLRTVRTAASAIAESIRSEQRAERKKKRGNRSFFRKSSEKKRPEPKQESSGPVAEVPGTRRNVYVNWPLPHMELDSSGEPTARYVRNKVRTTSEYTFNSLAALLIFFCRIHHPYLHPQELIRTVQTV